MSTFVFPPAEQLSEVTEGLAANLATYKIHLLNAVVPLNPIPSLATLLLSEADFTGYAAIAITGPPIPYPDPVQGGVSFTSPNLPFTVGASPTVTNNIYGFWVEYPSTDPTALFLLVLFNAPIQMSDQGDQCNVQFSLNYFGNQGLIVTVNGNPA